MQVLRTMPAPIKASDLADQMEVSLRTVYRDIDSLRAAGAMIDGEAGYGYTLVDDPALPPMMFTVDEIEALVLGLKEVQASADPVLANAADCNRIYGWSSRRNVTDNTSPVDYLYGW